MTDTTTTDGTPLLRDAWQLNYTTFLGPLQIQVVLERAEGDVIAAGYVETSDGWTPLQDLTHEGNVVIFVSDAAIFPLQFTIDLGDQPHGTATDEGLFDRSYLPPMDVTVTSAAVPPLSALAGANLAIAAFDRYYPVLREPAALDGYTLYRPIGPGPFPVIVWGNGGARPSNEEFLTFLTQVAAHGYLVVAVGRPERRFTPSIGDRSPSVLGRALDWIASAPPSLPEADISLVAVAGQSAGSSMAWVAATHPSVRTLLAFNGASDAVASDPVVVAGVTVPTMIVSGGVTDVATTPLGADWDILDPNIPSIWVDHSEAGHIGLFHGANDPLAAAEGARHLGQEVEVQTTRLTICWLEWTLHGDTNALRYFAGDGNRLSGISGWSTHERNLT